MVGCTVTAACGVHLLEVSAIRRSGLSLCACRCFWSSALLIALRFCYKWDRNIVDTAL